jgi:Asp/Glu/hydantoin racemase
LAPATGALAEFRRYPCQIAVAGCCAEDARVNARNTRTGTGNMNGRLRSMEVRMAKGFNGILLSCKDEYSVNGPPVSCDNKV